MRILPPPLANLIGTTHVFEIKGHTYYDHGLFESFICSAIHPLEMSVPTIATPSKFTDAKKNKRLVVNNLYNKYITHIKHKFNQNFN